nr:substrate-binding domain-containing protein [Bifidobacterium longum]
MGYVGVLGQTTHRLYRRYWLHDGFARISGRRPINRIPQLDRAFGAGCGRPDLRARRVHCGHRAHSREEAVNDHRDDMPDAFIVAADSIAVGVLQAFTAAGVLVPRDTSVISINNQAIAQYTSPTLTSYDIDQNELADTAITMLAEAISSRRTLHHHTFISTTLVVRDSFVPAR